MVIAQLRSVESPTKQDGSRRTAGAALRYASRGLHKALMSALFSTVVVPIAIAAVAVVLLLGLWNMLRGGSPNTSQRLMRLRVLLQLIAIVIIMITIWALRR